MTTVTEYAIVNLHNLNSADTAVVIQSGDEQAIRDYAAKIADEGGTVDFVSGSDKRVQAARFKMQKLDLTAECADSPYVNSGIFLVDRNGEWAE